jgi:hypothetical protein
MRSYLLISGVIFFLIVLVHAARIASEGVRLVGEPDFIATSILAIGMCAWAGALFWRNK